MSGWRCWVHVSCTTPVFSVLLPRPVGALKYIYNWTIVAILNGLEACISWNVLHVDAMNLCASSNQLANILLKPSSPSSGCSLTL
ncbi:hypothetical protein BKA65DRAFT_519870, partial [Rhexocercosporidium sp. MPI-PUGE-AT-0058]